jgi:hypothetical protein
VSSCSNTKPLPLKATFYTAELRRRFTSLQSVVICVSLFSFEILNVPFYVRFTALTVMSENTGVTPCILVDKYRNFKLSAASIFRDKV